MSTDVEKASDRSSATLRIKFLNDSTGESFQLAKTSIKKSTLCIMHNDEKLDTLSLRLGAKQACSLSPLLFNIILEDLTSAKIH